jgi:antitoxin ParD1/3/4/toxin ParE1/3/4
MSVRYVLAPEAALDLVQIWRYLKKQSSVAVADRVESVIRAKIAFLAKTPGAGHWNKNLTDEAVRFFPVYSYLIVYRPEMEPLQVVSILHGHRKVERILKERLLQR